MKVAIVGGGPSGLVTLKTILDFNPNIHVEVFEAEDQLGGTFRYRSYDNATLVSSKQLTAFSDFRLPLSHHDHLSLPEYVQYLEDYADRFSLRPHIHLSTRVTKVRRGTDLEGGGHFLTYVPTKGGRLIEGLTGTTIHVSHLAICTGLHVVPSIPDVPGIEHIHNNTSEGNEDGSKSVAFHSAEYKSRDQLKGRRVLVLGTGETGMDVGYEAVKAPAKSIVLCTRQGFLSFPAVLSDFQVLGVKFDGHLPIDGLITNLFETAKVHPWVGQSHLRWFVSDFVIKRLLWVLTGTQAGCNQWVGELPPERLGRAYVFLNKSAKAMPYLNRPYKSRPAIFEAFARYLDPPDYSPDEPGIDMAPFPDHILPSGKVVFQTSGRKEAKAMMGRDIRPEVIVFATGYTQEWDIFTEGEYPVPREADVRDVYKSGDESVAFIGFIRPGVGAIPPIAEMQAQFWVLTIHQKIPKPVSEPYYHLLVNDDARIKYAVDYSTYVSTLARDMGSEPGLFELWWTYGFKVLYVFCFGAAFTPFYRLLGPWRTPSAVETTKTELYETIVRRGVTGNLMMGVIPMAFYAVVNLLTLCLEFVLRLAAPWLGLDVPQGALGAAIIKGRKTQVRNAPRSRQSKAVVKAE